MRRKSLPALGLALGLMASPAAACTTLDDALARFEAVTDAFTAQAATMSPNMFPVWTTKVEAFSAALGRSDYAAACAVVDENVVDLAVEIEGAPASSASVGDAPASPTGPVSAIVAATDASGPRHGRPRARPPRLW